MQQVAHHRPGRPPGARSAETRERILRVARDIFSELGFDATTFHAIAARADLTRPAINHYFPSKVVLYRELLARAEVLVIAPVIERARREADFMGRLSSFIMSVAQANAEDRSTMAFVVTAMMDGERRPELQPLIRNLHMGIREFLTWAITDAVERGELTVDSDTSSLVEMLTAVLWGTTFYIAFVGTTEESAAVTANLRLLLVNKLWRIN